MAVGLEAGTTALSAAVVEECGATAASVILQLALTRSHRKGLIYIHYMVASMSFRHHDPAPGTILPPFLFGQLKEQPIVILLVRRRGPARAPVRFRLTRQAGTKTARRTATPTREAAPRRDERPTLVVGAVQLVRSLELDEAASVGGEEVGATQNPSDFTKADRRRGTAYDRGKWDRASGCADVGSETGRAVIMGAAEMHELSLTEDGSADGAGVERPRPTSVVSGVLERVRHDAGRFDSRNESART